ncbi:MAG: hypothetical protein R3343_01890 [Nitriliruptorales bacterium]|nr:hypothetical protein [Nitriliruptorales bacterium]
MRCPTCNARNTDSAEWCSQCFAPLKTEPEPPPPADEQVATATQSPSQLEPATSTEQAGDAAAAPDVSSGPLLAGEGRFRHTDEGLDWRCQTCDTWNPIEVTTCTVCGKAFGQDLADEPDVNQDVSETTALVASAAAPGLGHILLGRSASGLARSATWLLWLVGGLWLLFEARSAGSSPVPALPLLAGALVIWVASPVDAVLLRRGEDRELLSPRVFLWLVVGVIAALLVTFLAATMTLPDAGG